jgi:hypothetical protein
MRRLILLILFSCCFNVFLAAPNGPTFSNTGATLLVKPYSDDALIRRSTSDQDLIDTGKHTVRLEKRLFFLIPLLIKAAVKARE